MIFTFCRPGTFLPLSPALISSPNDACCPAVRSTVAPSAGVAVPDAGADGGGEGPAGSIGGATRDVSSKNACLSAKVALSSGGACVGAGNSGTPILRRAAISGVAEGAERAVASGAALADMASGAAARASGAAALASGAAAALALASGAAALTSAGA